MNHNVYIKPFMLKYFNVYNDMILMFRKGLISDSTISRKKHKIQHSITSWKLYEKHVLDKDQTGMSIIYGDMFNSIITEYKGVEYVVLTPLGELTLSKVLYGYIHGNTFVLGVTLEDALTHFKRLGFIIPDYSEFNLSIKLNITSLDINNDLKNIVLTRLPYGTFKAIWKDLDVEIFELAFKYWCSYINFGYRHFYPSNDHEYDINHELPGGKYMLNMNVDLYHESSGFSYKMIYDILMRLFPPIAYLKYKAIFNYDFTSYQTDDTIYDLDLLVYLNKNIQYPIKFENSAIPVNIRKEITTLDAYNEDRDDYPGIIPIEFSKHLDRNAEIIQQSVPIMKYFYITEHEQSSDIKKIYQQETIILAAAIKYDRFEYVQPLAYFMLMKYIWYVENINPDRDTTFIKLMYKDKSRTIGVSFEYACKDSEFRALCVNSIIIAFTVLNKRQKEILVHFLKLNVYCLYEDVCKKYLENANLFSI